MSMLLVAVSAATLLLSSLARCSTDLEKLHSATGRTTLSLDQLLHLYREIDLDLMQVEIDARRLVEV